VVDRIQSLLESLAAQATGNSNRIERAMLLERPPSLDDGEITDKGSLNQRVFLARRATLVEELYAEGPSARVLCVRETC
jgi:feruloyl-CoA synthase